MFSIASLQGSTLGRDDPVQEDAWLATIVMLG